MINTCAQLVWTVCSHLDLDTEDTLSEENVSNGLVHEVLGRLTGVDHETVGELGVTNKEIVYGELYCIE